MPDLPRYELREDAFRKYEPIIALAAKSTSYVVDLNEFATTLSNPRGFRTKGMKGRTFICRFNDAKLAYRVYGYPSTIIPKDADVSLLRAIEQDDGRVRIDNLGKQATAVVASFNEVPSFTDEVAMTAYINRIFAGDILPSGGLEAVYIDVPYGIDLSWVRTMAVTIPSHIGEIDFDARKGKIAVVKY